MHRQGRRLSFWRVLLALLILAGLGTGTYYGLQQWKLQRVSTSREPWFAAYADVTATPSFAFEQLGTTGHKDVVLSFVVPKSGTGCTPTWGGAYTLDQASSMLDLDRRIERLRQQGGNIAVSFGGLLNSELAVTCTNNDDLYKAYKTVIDRYKLDTIDLDLEDKGLNDPAAATRRSTVIAKLQAERRQQGKPLAVWVTLPVAPQGLSEAGTTAVTTLLSKGVDLAGINLMTMDYGASRAKDQSMIQASESALIQAHRQLGILYQQAGIYLNSGTLWSKIGATPMIGQNDESNEIFTVKDAQALNAFVHQKGMLRMSMWSANRDLACGDNYTDLKIVSDSCSGVKQDKYAFTAALAHNFKGRLSQSAGNQTAPDSKSAKQKADNPKTSPYQIWSADGSYLKGTKVVWHQNVYEAKWWTKGDLPDSPVLQTWQSPWDLIGPVLAGEKPVPQQTLPTGTYPEWSGDAKYDSGQRVLFDGVPYQAKWWSQGQSPAAASSNPDGSPWAALTQSQINQVTDKQ